MFEGLLPENIGIFAVTASNSTAPSFACFYDEKLDTFLGDAFSVSWMQNADSENIEKETIEEQMEKIANSTAMYGENGHFGNTSIAKDIVGVFQGLKDTESSDNALDITDAVPAYEVPIARLEMNKKNNSDKIHAVKKGRKFIDSVVEDIVYKVIGEPDNQNNIFEQVQQIRDFDCFRKVVNVFHEKCFNLGENGYALRKIHILANLCGSEVLHVNKDDNSGKIINVIQDMCNHPKMVEIN